MKLSVVTVCYNCKQDIEESILQVLNQDFKDLEFLIIDGASSDGTLDIINKYKDQIAYISSEPDNGIYDAMNKGIRKASGEWIFFFNVGDRFYNNHVLSSVFSQDLSDFDVCYGDYYSDLDKGVTLIKAQTPFFKDKRKFHGMGFSHQSVFTRSSLAKEHPFVDNLKYCADYNMMMTLYKHKYKFHYLNLPITIVYGKGGFSASNRKRQRYEEAMVCGVENTVFFKCFCVYEDIKLKIRGLVIPVYLMIKRHPK